MSIGSHESKESMIYKIIMGLGQSRCFDSAPLMFKWLPLSIHYLFFG